MGTVSEYHNQLLPECSTTLNDCEGVSKLKGMPGILQSNKVPGSIKTKVLTGSMTIKKECM